MRSVLVIVTYVFSHESFEGVVRSIRSHGPASLVGNSQPSARRPRSAKDYENAVRTGSLPRALAAQTTSTPNFESWSKRRNLCAGSYGRASRICCTIHQSTRVPCDIEAQNLPPLVTNDKEAIQDAEGDRRHGEEVHSCNRLAMVSQECAASACQRQLDATPRRFSASPALVELPSLLPSSSNPTLTYRSNISPVLENVSGRRGVVSAHCSGNQSAWG